MQIQPRSPPSHVAGPSIDCLAPSDLALAKSDHGFLTTHARAWLWWTVLLLIVSNVVVLAVFAYVYSQSAQFDSLLWVLRSFFLFAETNAFLVHNSTRIAVAYGSLSAVFAGIALRMMLTSIRRRRGVVSSARGPTTSRLHGVTRAATAATRRSVAYCPTRVRRSIRSLRHAMGVRGPYFELRLIVEEWVELATQTAAAHSASQSISNPPLNVTYAVVIWVNSISTHVFTRVFRHSLLHQRLACVVTDLLLDFMWGTLLPVWMYKPIVEAYTVRASLLSDLTSFSGFTRHVERILILSWKSLALSVFPFCSSLLKLLDLQTILRELAATHSRSTGPTPLHIARYHHGWLVRVAHALMPLYGLGVLLTSLAANEVFYGTHKQDAIHCGYRVHPWFSTEEACLQRRLNCSTLRVTGTETHLAPMLDLFDHASLSEIFFVDCPAFEMPANIRQFAWLMAIGLVNSTVVSWDTRAQLSEDAFPDLRSVFLFDIQFVHDPVGFTGANAPITPSLEWVYLENVDGKRLLPLVSDHWNSLLTFNCLRCGLTAFPRLAYELPRLAYFSLSYNDISSIPDDWLGDQSLQLQMLWLDENGKLSQLPDSLWRQAATCAVFSIEGTNVSIVPEWVADVAFPGFVVSARGSPLCTNKASLPPRIQALVSCTSSY